MDDEQHPEESEEELEEIARTLLQNLRLKANVYKVVGSVCLAGGKTAIAALEAGTARLQLSKLRSETRAAELVETNQLTPEHRGMRHLAKNQKLLDGIVFDSLKRLGVRAAKEPEPSDDQASQETNRKEISDDWLEAFRHEAGIRGHGEMREAFVRILAGEMHTPGSFSIKAVRTLGTISQETATLFRRAAGLRIGIEIPHKDLLVIDARIPSLGQNLGMNSLEQEGLSYHSLLSLVEDGLIYPDLNNRRDYNIAILHPPEQNQPFAVLGLVHQGKRWVLVPKQGFQKRENFWIDGAEFTEVGKELLQVVVVEPDPKFLEKVREFFKGQNLDMVEVPLPTSTTPPSSPS